MLDSEGVLEHVGASPTLPAGHAEGQPHAVHVALEVAPRAALYEPAAHERQAAIVELPVLGLYVPAPHCVGATEP